MLAKILAQAEGLTSGLAFRLALVTGPAVVVQVAVLLRPVGSCEFALEEVLEVLPFPW